MVNAYMQYIYIFFCSDSNFYYKFSEVKFMIDEFSKKIEELMSIVNY